MAYYRVYGIIEEEYESVVEAKSKNGAIAELEYEEGVSFNYAAAERITKQEYEEEKEL
jgi:hypothetical protein